MSSSFWFLHLLSCVYIVPHVRAYTKVATPPLQVDGDWSSKIDDARSYASCTSSNYPTLISCGLESGHHQIDGSFVNSGGGCEAQNGLLNTAGVLAVALCATGDYTCTYHKGERSGSGDDDASTIGCSSNSGAIMISCTAQSSWDSIDGAYIGTRSQSTTITPSALCTAYHDGDPSYGVYAHGICCTYNDIVNDGYELDCKTKWGDEASNAVSIASCDSGYSAFACMGYSKYKNTLAGYYPVSVGSCGAISESSSSVQAVATCCRLYKEPTPLPTVDPTFTPTSNPTSNPTFNPTVAPTFAPTHLPSVSPTNAPTNSPSKSPQEHIHAYVEPVVTKRPTTKAYENSVNTTHSQELDENDTEQEHRSPAKKQSALIIFGIATLCVIILCGAVFIYRGCVNKRKAITKQLSMIVDADNEVVQKKPSNIELHVDLDEDHEVQIGEVRNMFTNAVIQDIDTNHSNSAGGPEADNESEGDTEANDDDNEMVHAQGLDHKTKGQNTDDGFQDRIVYDGGYDVDYIDEQ